METLIRQEAATQSVDELTTANVIANSYQLISSDSQLNEPNVVVNQEEVQSSAPLVSTTVTGLVVLLLCYIRGMLIQGIYTAYSLWGDTHSEYEY